MDYFNRGRRLDNWVFFILIVLGLAAVTLNVVREITSAPRLSSDDECGTRSMSAAIDALLKNHTRFVALIGDGVPGQFLITDRPYNTQFAQGYDLYQGVQHALRNPLLKTTLDKVGMLYVDDGGNSRCAATLADTLRRRPELVGVIGHSTTACTLASLNAYQQSNIPVLIPAATNPALLLGHERHAFRLPSNDNVQSLVLAHVIVRELKARSVFVVWDATRDAEQYAEYIKNQVQHYITAPQPLELTREQVPVLEGSYPISLSPLNYSYLFGRIVSSDPDVVVFAGYGSLAREFMLGLDHEYASTYPKRRRPKIILTDGCKIPGLQSYGFDTYVTFAAKPLKSFPAFQNFITGMPIGGFQEMLATESFEVFGYDAAMILFSAIAEASSRNAGSREEIMTAIRDNARRYPTAYSYEFSNGENERNRYYCYSLNTESVAYAYEDEVVPPLALIRKDQSR